MAPRSLIAVAVGPVAWSAGAETLAWVALVLVPPGSALALGWASHGARAWLAVLVLPLLAGALAVPDAPVGEWVRIALIAGAAVIAARLVAGAARISLLQAGVVAIAVIDATFIFGDLAEH